VDLDGIEMVSFFSAEFMDEYGSGIPGIAEPGSGDRHQRTSWRFGARAERSVIR
jgi:hypothetical protein